MFFIQKKHELPPIQTHILKQEKEQERIRQRLRFSFYLAL